jgi:hypothetical protein
MFWCYAWMDLSEVHKWNFCITVMWKVAFNCTYIIVCSLHKWHKSIKCFGGHVCVATCLHACKKGQTVLKFGAQCGRLATQMSLTMDLLQEAKWKLSFHLDLFCKFWVELICFTVWECCGVACFVQVWSVCGSNTAHFPRFQWKESHSVRSSSQFQYCVLWTWWRRRREGRQGEWFCQQHCTKEPLLAAASLSAVHTAEHCHSGVCGTFPHKLILFKSFQWCNHTELFNWIMVKINWSLVWHFILFTWLVTQREKKEQTVIWKQSLLVIKIYVREHMDVVLFLELTLK